ncbi:unnamed protein product [Arctogadus glacialis]
MLQSPEHPQAPRVGLDEVLMCFTPRQEPNVALGFADTDSPGFADKSTTAPYSGHFSLVGRDGAYKRGPELSQEPLWLKDSEAEWLALCLRVLLAL